jgi:putative transcriptional regulator
MDSLAGNLLIASTELVNDFFAQSVVLVLQHSDEGAAGIVLNKPSDVSIQKIWPEITDENEKRVLKCVNIGGPCEGPVVAIHSSLELTEVPLLPGVALSVKSENVKRLLGQSYQPVRLYSGYAGWSAGQLESEIDRGGWYSTQANSELVFTDPFDLWRSACDEFGEKIIAPVIGARIPDDPSWN